MASPVVPVSQSCAVAKREKFWRATEQSNLAYKRLAATKASKVWPVEQTSIRFPHPRRPGLERSRAVGVQLQEIVDVPISFTMTMSLTTRSVLLNTSWIVLE